MSFRSVVNGECFEEASFNNTLSDSFQEPAVSNMSVAMVTAACLCSASHICVFHGPPSFYWWRSLKNILHWEQLQLWPSTVEAAPTALHSATGLLETELQRVSLHTSCERRKSIKLKGDETSAPPDLTEQPAPPRTPPPRVRPTELSPISRELKSSRGWWGCRSRCSVPTFSHSFGEGGLKAWGTCF